MKLTDEEKNAVRLTSKIYCQGIKRPMAIAYICQEIMEGDYSAEMLLQHLLLNIAERIDKE